MKILILLTYFNRPILVRNALRSIADTSHDQWELIFGDDGSPNPGEPICREILGDHLGKIQFINSHVAAEQKFQEGISIGKIANRLIAESDSDIAITLCDDDALRPDYLTELSLYFEDNPTQYAYSHISIFNPLIEPPGEMRLDHKFNAFRNPVNPAGRLDTSQVAFRTSTVRDHGCRYPETTAIGDKPWLMNLDAGLFQSIFDRFGPAPFTGLVGQYKGIHDHQLVWHKNNGKLGLENYLRSSGSLAGKTL